MKRQDLSLKKPENTSLSRATSLIKLVWLNFTQILTSFTIIPIYTRKYLQLRRNWHNNGCPSSKYCSQKGNEASRADCICRKGLTNNNVWNCECRWKLYSTTFLFPRARFLDTMLAGAPLGNLGLVNSPTSGWMTGPSFLKVLEHIQKITRCAKENKLLILMDNHECQCTLDASLYIKNHCTHILQPLDVSVMAP